MKVHYGDGHCRGKQKHRVPYLIRDMPHVKKGSHADRLRCVLDGWLGWISWEPNGSHRADNPIKVLAVRV